MSDLRVITHLARGVPTSDGAGVRLTRLVGHQGLPDIDPFLMLDRFESDDPDDYIAGFPDHPHRGFETVTIMLAGRMQHRDSRGNSGVVEPGGVQWMTTGRGLVHSEMPEQAEGRMAGFQLWLNLPASHKMIEPAWRDIPASEIPVDEREGARVHVIAGRSSAGVEGPAASAGPDTDVLLMRVELAPSAEFQEPLPTGHNVMIAVYDGELTAASSDGDATTAAAPSLAVLSAEGSAAVRAGPHGAAFLLAAARPIGEKIARYGPFVMNERHELEQAVADFRAGRF